MSTDKKAVIRARLAALRSEMLSKDIDFYLIGSEDFHGSGYVGEYFRCRAFVSGFTGSAGTLVVSQETAGLWTDGRYFIQAADQLSDTGITLFKMGEEGVPTVFDYIMEAIQPGQTLGFDGRTIGAKAGLHYKEALEKKGAALMAADPESGLPIDLVNAIWTGRPSLSHEPAWIMPAHHAGEERALKLARVRGAMKEAGADLHILTSLDDIAWLLNIRGNDVKDNPVVMAYVIMDQECVHLYTAEDAFSAEAAEELREDGVICHPYGAVYADVPVITSGKSVLYNEEGTNYAMVCALAPDAVAICQENPSQLMKAIKNPVEVERIRAAHVKDGIALTKFMYWLKQNRGKVPMTEISLGEKMESFRKEQEGYLCPSFDPIVGYGVHGAIVHYSATPESDIPVEPKGLVLMDTGGQYLEGTTDITRTFAMGPVTEEEKKFFTLVLKGHLNLSGVKFRHGCTGMNLDYVAREPLWQLGLDYNHGTGHGVGYLLNVHEGPNGFRWRRMPGKSEGAVFEEGMVTSNEPGFYLEGKFGVRHENLILCKKAEKNEYAQFMQFENLTLVPFDLEAVAVSMLTEREKQLLNDYHRQIIDTVGPHLEPEELEWLKEAAAPVV